MGVGGMRVSPACREAIFILGMTAQDFSRKLFGPFLTPDTGKLQGDVPWRVCDFRSHGLSVSPSVYNTCHLLCPVLCPIAPLSMGNSYQFRVGPRALIFQTSYS